MNNTISETGKKNSSCQLKFNFHDFIGSVQLSPKHDMRLRQTTNPNCVQLEVVQHQSQLYYFR